MYTVIKNDNYLPIIVVKLCKNHSTAEIIITYSIIFFYNIVFHTSIRIFCQISKTPNYLPIIPTNNSINLFCTHVEYVFLLFFFIIRTIVILLFILYASHPLKNDFNKSSNRIMWNRFLNNWYCLLDNIKILI